MTAPRLARAGRSRFFIGVGSLILMIGFVAIFHSSQTQLEDSKQSIRRCEQQQEALNARVQAVSGHEKRLVKTLEFERKEHSDLEQKLKDQKEIDDKTLLELNVRFDSMQQQYKRLQHEHNDLADECTKSKGSQSEQINSLESKVKSLQSQIQQSKTQREKEVEEWKVKYENQAQENARLKLSADDNALEKCTIHTASLEARLGKYKENCAYRDEDSNINVLKPPTPAQQKNPNAFSHPLDKPIVQKSFKEQQLIAPKPILSSSDQKQVSKSSPTPLNALSVANSPTPASDKSKRSSTLANNRLKSKQVELGVAPVPGNLDELFENGENNKVDDDGINPNNRYANALNEISAKNGEQDNAAHEVKDTDFNIALGGDDKNDGGDHIQEGFENMNNNAAEDDANFFDVKPVAGGLGHKKDHGELEDDGVDILGGGKRDKNEAGGDEDGHNLNDEVMGDQGKEPEFAEDIQIAEQNDEDEDEDDYSNQAARKQEGPAIRN